MLAVCGTNCGTCQGLGSVCTDGCVASKGQAFWTRQMGIPVCPIYQCVQDNRYSDCGSCAQIPCNLWMMIKSPEVTEEQHRTSVQERMNALKAGKG